jgi:hypothetical protein
MMRASKRRRSMTADISELQADDSAKKRYPYKTMKAEAR